MSNTSKQVIWNAVLSTLQAAQAGGQPLAFVGANSIYDGLYPDLNALPPESFPAIFMEPDEDDEAWFTVGMAPSIKSIFKINISCMVMESQFNKGISGDATQSPRLVGLLEFVDTVKQVLQADMSLGLASMQKVYFPKARYFFEAYPIRECKISVVLESQLTTTTH